jgi:leucyl aminopeptidase
MINKENDCFAISINNKQDLLVDIVPIWQSNFAQWLKTQNSTVKNLTITNRFTAQANTFCLLVDQNGKLKQVLLGIENNDDFLAFGLLPKILPAGYYRINAAEFSEKQLKNAAIGWGMGSYQFFVYKKSSKSNTKLLCNNNYDFKNINSIISSIFFVRDLINIPSGDLHPKKLADIAQNIAKEFGAKFKKISGEELRKKFPAIHAVGKGSSNQPILIDLCFGSNKDPKIVLVGKGVCFDSGGLQLKSSANMLLMKKDMAGAAHVLGLARMIMLEKLPINLRVIIPAVENLISGNSLKPGDIIKTRAGLSIEVANTDAEGRLILADALSYASEWQPKMILDFATLTGAARVALGPDITALFASNNQLAQDISAEMVEEHEPVWHMPLYRPYLKLLKSSIADFKNVSMLGDSGATVGGGAITAALFLQQFVSRDIPWVHFDMNAYNEKTSPGRPEGGEAVCLNGVFQYLKKKFYNNLGKVKK